MSRHEQMDKSACELRRANKSEAREWEAELEEIERRRKEMEGRGGLRSTLG